MPEMQTAARPQSAAGPAPLGELVVHRSVSRRAEKLPPPQFLEHVGHLRAILTTKTMGTVVGANEDAG